MPFKENALDRLSIDEGIAISNLEGATNMFPEWQTDTYYQLVDSQLTRPIESVKSFCNTKTDFILENKNVLPETQNGREGYTHQEVFQISDIAQQIVLQCKRYIY